MKTSLPHRFIIRTLAAALAFGATGSVLQSQAGTATDNLAVTATVPTSCVIAGGTLAFGDYDPIVTNVAAPLDASTGITVTCTTGSAVSITLGQGVTPDGASTATVPLRQLANGSGRLGYLLYSDAGHSTVWGDNVSNAVSDTGVGTAHRLTVYGEIAGGQNPIPGAYTDTVIATATF